MQAVANFQSGVVNGKVEFFQCDSRSPVMVKINLSTYVPNTRHGMHIHEYGDRSRGPMSAGDHFNPYNSKHGPMYSTQRHAGDLINNIETDSSGVVSYRYEDATISLFYDSPVCIIGRSVVIHAEEDDLGLAGTKVSAMNGTSGRRIDSAVIGLAEFIPSLNLNRSACHKPSNVPSITTISGNNRTLLFNALNKCATKQRFTGGRF